MKAVAYLRVSGASQLDGEGFGRQLDTITAYAQANGFELVGSYREEAVPGKTDMADRPAFLEMLSDLLSNGCRTIIVERLDRLAREYRVQEELLLFLMRKGLTLISADTGEDITAAMGADPMRKALIQIQGIFAELEKSLLVLKLRKARTAVQARGEYAGGYRRYGQARTNASPAERAEAEREQACARRIWQLRDEGYTYGEIRDMLTEEGFTPRHSETWQLSSIKAIAYRKPTTN